MSPAWWITILILSLYLVQVPWMLWLGHPWAAGYWLCAAGITICAMRGLTS